VSHRARGQDGAAAPLHASLGRPFSGARLFNLVDAAGEFGILERRIRREEERVASIQNTNALGRTATARGTGARQSAPFTGRIRGRLNPEDLGRMAGRIHHNPVGIAIRRFTQRLQSDRIPLKMSSLSRGN